MLRRKGLRREKRMPYIQMNCKNCGAPLERQGDSFVCGHCGSRVFRILDAKIEAGQDILSREEFEKALQEQKNTAGADLGDGLRRFDAGSGLLNAQLKQASVLLHDGKPYAVEEALEGVPDTIFAAECLRLLAQTGAKDEQSLSLWAGDLRSSEHFERVMALADFEQKRVYERIAAVIGRGEGVTPAMAQRIKTEIRYAGYIAREERIIRDIQRHENVTIPEDFDYSPIETMTLEAREKLSRIRPRSLGQAGRIPGVSPSDLAQLSIALAAAQKQNKEAHHD